MSEPSRAACLLCVAISVVVLACVPSVAGTGGKEGGVQAAVAFGANATRGAFPFIASVVLRTGYPNCGGTLILPRLVVTSAHCVVDDKLKPTGVAGAAIGALNLADPKDPYEYRNVTKVVRHPLYNAKTRANDIALLVLDKPAKAKPAALAPANFKLPPGEVGGELLFIAGWGLTESGKPSAMLKFGRVPIWSIALCNKVWGMIGLPAMPSSHICAGWGEDYQDTCVGDSGGPLVRIPKTGQAVLVGVTSYGQEKCGTQANLGAYASIPRLRPWIDAQIKALKL